MKSRLAGHSALATLLLVIACAASAETAGDGYATLFEEALKAVEWDARKHWAYTETASGSDGEFVGRYDPRLPEAERWTLVSIDGRPPDEAESREYAERKRREHDDDRDGDEDDDRDIDGMVDPGSLELIEETADYWLLRFVPTGDDDEEGGGDDASDAAMGRKVMEQMDGTVKIVKDGRYLEYLDIRNTAPIRPKVGVKMKNFLMRMTFGPAVEDGPIVMKSMDVAIKLNAFLVVRIDETESLQRSDFEFAGNAG